MSSPVWFFEPDTQETWAYYHNALSKEECDEIKKIANNKSFEVARLGKESIKDESVRKSELVWLHPSDNLEHIYQKLTDVIVLLNEKFFNFELFGFAESIQFTKYTFPDGKYGKHIDKNKGKLFRKLSIIVQLTNPDEYEGGKVLIHGSGKPDVLPTTQGSLYAFPSYVLHEVTPVTKGERCSLVAWLTGPLFK